MKHGADINRVDKDDETSLFKACKNKNEAVVKIFSGTWSNDKYDQLLW